MGGSSLPLGIADWGVGYLEGIPPIYPSFPSWDCRSFGGLVVEEERWEGRLYSRWDCKAREDGRVRILPSYRTWGQSEGGVGGTIASFFLPILELWRPGGLRGWKTLPPVFKTPVRREAGPKGVYWYKLENGHRLDIFVDLISFNFILTANSVSCLLININGDQSSGGVISLSSWDWRSRAWKFFSSTGWLPWSKPVSRIRTNSVKCWENPRSA